MGNSKTKIEYLVEILTTKLKDVFVKKDEHTKEIQLLESRIENIYLKKNEQVDITHATLQKVVSMIELLNKNTIKDNSINKGVTDVRKTYELISSKLDKPKELKEFIDNPFSNNI
jgi:hypothetical protein